MKRKSQVSSGLSLAAAWVAFAVTHATGNLVVPSFQAALADTGVVMPGFLQLMISIVGMWGHLVLALASTAIVLAYEMKVEDPERRHLAAVGTLFLNFVWATVFLWSVYLPWFALSNAVG